MKLYNLSEVKANILNQLSRKEQASEQAGFIFEAYTVRYAIDKLSVPEIHMFISEDPKFTFYVDDEQISKINLLVKLKTGFDLNFDKCKYYDYEDHQIFSRKVNTSDDLKDVVKSFKMVDIVANAIKEDEDARKIRKEKNIELHNRLSNVDHHSVLGKKIVAIDFEFDPNDKSDPFTFDNITELGFTFYENGNIYSEHLIVDENKRSKHKMNLQSNFLFGESDTIKINDIGSVIQNIIDRNDVIVFHSYSSEMRFLDNHNIDISEKEIYDTQLIYKTFFDDNNPNTKKLAHMLQNFKMPYGFLHNAGNDSYHTMKVFELMINRINHPEVKRKNLLKVA